jgi:CBS-domain-containing membrane protein
MQTLSRRMRTQIAGAAADEHLRGILDRMAKNKHHRLQVLENGRLMGVVYISQIYYHFFL